MIRRGAHADVTFMRSMLAHAYHWRVAGLDAPIPLARYIENWGREGDVAVIAMEHGHRIGAAWLRRFPASAPGYAFVDEQTAELTISVVPSRRRQIEMHRIPKPASTIPPSGRDPLATATANPATRPAAASGAVGRRRATPTEHYGNDPGPDA